MRSLMTTGLLAAALVTAAGCGGDGSASKPQDGVSYTPKGKDGKEKKGSVEKFETPPPPPRG